MLKKNLYKFLLIVPALVGMSLMAASIPSNSNSKENTTVADNEEGIVVDERQVSRRYEDVERKLSHYYVFSLKELRILHQGKEDK